MIEEIRRRLERVRPELLRSASPMWREAGVLVPLLQHPEGLRLVLIRRGTTLAKHGGQIAFPGGTRDPGDPDLQFTALRETHEEIGLAPEAVEVLGRLDDVWTPSGFLLSSFVGVVPWPQEFRPQEVEVEEVLEAPLERLMEEGCFREEIWHRDGIDHPIAFFDLDGFTVWGATGRIIARLLEVGFGWRNPGRPWAPGPLPR